MSGPSKVKQQCYHECPRCKKNWSHLVPSQNQAPDRYYSLCENCKPPEPPPNNLLDAAKS